MVNEIKGYIAKILGTKQEEIKLLSSSCHFLELLYRNNKFRAETVPKDKRRVHLSFFFDSTGISKSDKRKCFNKVKALISQYELKSAVETLKEYGRRFPSRINDLDKGPAIFIDCNKKDLVSSIPTLVHEMTHALARRTPEKVVYYRPVLPDLELNIKFDFDIGEKIFKKFLKKLRIKKKEEIRFLELYATLSFTVLIDEINAYTTSNAIAFTLLKKNLSKDHGGAKKGGPPIILFNIAPLLAFIHFSFNEAGDYFRKWHPDLWKELTANPQNKRTINMFWWEAVTLSNQIYKYLKTNNLYVYPLEEKGFKYIKKHSDTVLIR